MFATFEPGTEVEISYPESTHVLHWRPDRCRRRDIIIHHVRDLVTDPLTVAEFMRRPFLLRSRWLVRALEPQRNQWRQFYLGSTREFALPGLLRVGLFEPQAERPSWLHDRRFGATLSDRRALVELVKHWGRIDFGQAKLGIFADDPEITDRFRIANLH